MDGKSREEQSTELLTKEEYKDLPEVIELRRQVEEIEDKKDGKQPGNGGEITTSNDKQLVPTVKEIESRLKEKLAVLQGEYYSKLGGLIASAKHEYKSLESGQGSGSKKELAEKYLSLAEGLEAQCDARVYAAIAYAENELRLYGYQSSVPDEARNAYKEAKSERRQQLLSEL